MTSQLHLFLAFCINTPTFLALSLLFAVFLVVYLMLVVRAIREMLRHAVKGVFLAFAFLALIPFPPFIIMGICILVLWRLHQRDIDTIPLK